MLWVAFLPIMLPEITGCYFNSLSTFIFLCTEYFLLWFLGVFEKTVSHSYVKWLTSHSGCLSALRNRPFCRVKFLPIYCKIDVWVLFYNCCFCARCSWTLFDNVLYVNHFGLFCLYFSSCSLGNIKDISTKNYFFNILHSIKIVNPSYSLLQYQLNF